MGDKNSAFAAAEVGTELGDSEPHEHVRSFAGLIDDGNALDLLNYYDSVLDEPIEETAIGQQLLANIETRTVNDGVQEGNVSLMKRAMGMTDNTESEQQLLQDVADRLANEGTIGLMIGSPASGKTALSLDIARVWAALTGGTVIGNTEWDGFSEVVTSDTAMLEAMASTEGQVLAVIDETAQDLSGFGEGMKPAEEFSDALTFIRKHEGRHGRYAKRGSVLMISHTYTKTAKPFRDLAMFAVEKPTNNDKGRAVLLDSRSDKDEFDPLYTVKGLTDTTETYDEHESSEFAIHGTDGDGDDEHTSEDVDEAAETAKRQQQVRTVIEAVVEEDMSYRAAANLPGVNYSRGWVGDRVDEYEDGEHRELFNGDAPIVEN